ncbi:hypothetical protein [Corynebacterium sp. HMSC29G08]|nr:hypothetical protein [Corynebacterium sp. HMSC29G08]
MFRRKATAAKTLDMPPMEAVTTAMREGARSRREICRRTGLSTSTVDAIIHHLERTDLLKLEPLGSACCAGGCGSCSASKSCTGERTASGPVALVLMTRPGAAGK